MPPELVGGLAHRWTWAVVMASLAEAFTADDEGQQPEATTCAGLERIAPPEAIDWILEDPEVTAALREFLSGDGGRGGSLAAIIRRAEQDVLGSGPVSPPDEGVSTDAGEVETVAVPVLHAAASPIARAFLDWIRDVVTRGTIEVNTSRAAVCRLAEGTLLVVPGVFREYARCVAMGECPCPRELSASGRDIARTVRRQVLRAGLHVSPKDGVELVDGRLAGGESVRGLLLRSSVSVLGEDVPVAGSVLAASGIAEAMSHG
jgi:hypothetical protein